VGEMAYKEVSELREWSGAF